MIASFSGAASWSHMLRATMGGRDPRDTGGAFSALCITTGQEGSLALVDALLRLTAPEGGVRLTFSIWRGRGADLRAVEAWCKTSRLESARFLVDRGFDPALRAILERRFGADCISTGPMHAKIALLERPGHRPFAVVCSASLNPARRLEHWLVTDDAAATNAVLRLIAGRVDDPRAQRSLNGRDPGFALGFAGRDLDAVQQLEQMVHLDPGRDLDVGCWTLSQPHHRRIKHLQANGLVGRVRWLVDGSMITAAGNAGAALADLRDVWGDDSIRGCSIHGKFFRLVGSQAVWTSANLNRNPRIESWVRGGEALDALTGAVVDHVWERQPAGACFARGQWRRVNRSLQRSTASIMESFRRRLHGPQAELSL